MTDSELVRSSTWCNPSRISVSGKPMRTCEKNILMNLRTQNFTKEFFAHIYRGQGIQGGHQILMLVQDLTECASQTPNSAQLETCRSTFFNPPDKRVIALFKIWEHKTLTEERHKNLLQGMGSLCCTKTIEVRITRVCLPQIHALWQPAMFPCKCQFFFFFLFLFILRGVE